MEQDSLNEEPEVQAVKELCADCWFAKFCMHYRNILKILPKAA